MQWPHRKWSPDSLAAPVALQSWQTVKPALRGNAFPGFLISVSPTVPQVLPGWLRRESPSPPFTGKVEGLSWKSFHFCSLPCPVLACTSCESQWRWPFFPASTSLWCLNVILSNQSGLAHPVPVTWVSELIMIHLTFNTAGWRTGKFWPHCVTLTTSCREPFQLTRGIGPT